jgi:hypothetical protein
MDRGQGRQEWRHGRWSGRRTERSRGAAGCRTGTRGRGRRAGRGQAGAAHQRRVAQRRLMELEEGEGERIETLALYHVRRNGS